MQESLTIWYACYLPMYTYHYAKPWLGIFLCQIRFKQVVSFSPPEVIKTGAFFIQKGSLIYGGRGHFVCGEQPIVKLGCSYNLLKCNTLESSAPSTPVALKLGSIEPHEFNESASGT